MVLPRSSPALLRTLTASQPVRAGARAAWQHRRQLAARRFYADQGGHGEQGKKSDLPWMMGAIAFTVPAAVYLYNSGPPEKEHGLGPQRPVVKGDDGPSSHDSEIKEETEETTPSEDETKPEEDAQKEAAGEKGDNKPSERDPPRAYKGAESPTTKSGAESAKQQGISNTETKHPELNAPGKSQKAEGETDSAKLKGTVAPERPKGEDH